MYFLQTIYHAFRKQFLINFLQTISHAFLANNFPCISCKQFPIYPLFFRLSKPDEVTEQTVISLTNWTGNFLLGLKSSETLKEDPILKRVIARTYNAKNSFFEALSINRAFQRINQNLWLHIMDIELSLSLSAVTHTEWYLALFF